jgi:tocopherol O-methyltransferase
MSATRITNTQEIIDYYKYCEVDYSIVWHLKNHMSMHYGYWEPETKRLRDALHLMNQKLAEYAEITPSDHVCDAGCGVGGSAVFLAKTFGCRVHGITLSENQVLTSRENASRQGVEHQVAFSQRNYLDTQFPSETFDIVWAIESVCYAGDKEDFLAEAYRILKPGGRLAIADFFREKIEPRTEDDILMRRWVKSWAIPDYAVTVEFEEKMRRVGFEDHHIRDITPKVYPSIKRLYQAFFPGFLLTYLLQFLGIRNKLQTANTWSTYYQYHAYKRNLWRYNMVTARKPI